MVLNQHSDFEQLKHSGNRVFSGSWLLVNFKKNRVKQLRCGWTLPRYVGNAVLRNNFKRWIRCYLREKSQKLSVECGLDVNIIFRRKPKGFYEGIRYEEFTRAMQRGSEKLCSRKGR